MISQLVARVRSIWRGVRYGRALQAQMDAEFRHHMELRARDLVREGLSPREAARRARIEFGNAERYKEEGRVSRGLRPFDQIGISWLDFKLGFRMLAKYPGLTLVGGLAMAFAIWVGAGTFEIVTQLISPALPLDEGRRVVGIRMWDVARNRAESHVLHDFAAWRESVKSVQDLGAFRTLERNLIAGAGVGEPVEVAEISASAFRVARVAPLLGRTLVQDDEQPGAPAVAVIGHDVWQRRFEGDSAVVGRAVRIGALPTTIVGVMPEGFAFPVAQSLWMPLRLSALDYQRRQGPQLTVFGRLADGASMADARTELETIGKRASAAFKDTHEHLRPQVMPYAQSILDVTGWERIFALSANLPVALLLVLVCANVALLMFARAATRESELVVRTALGASRGRIVTQLFAEALVLGGVAAVVGLLAAGRGIRWAYNVIEMEMMSGGRLPFWFRDGLSTTTIGYAILLTLLSAVIAGVVPALKVTRGMGTRLKEVSAGGGGLKFGGLWTAVIVAQIAVTVAFPVVTWAVRRDAMQIRAIHLGLPEQEYLTLRLEMDRVLPGGEGAADTSRAAFLARYRKTYQELERRLKADPAVRGVAFADRLPRMYHPHRLVDVDAGGSAPLHPQWPAYRVSSISAGPGFFQALGVPILAGRDFTGADHEVGRGPEGVPDPDTRPPTAGSCGAGCATPAAVANGGPVIVNESFVRRVLGGRNPIGRRVRYRLFEEWEGPRRLREPGPWYEIVGVVRDLGLVAQSSSEGDPKASGIYHPVPAGGVYPSNIAVHLHGDAAAFMPRLRTLATAVDPTLRLYDVRRMSEISDAELYFLSFWFRLLVAVSGIALTLSLAGIYAVMAFTVTRRTREIGIRIALGASARRVILTTFRRPFTQVALGVLTGAVFLGTMLGLAQNRVPSLETLGVLAAYSLGMFAICLLACIVPTRRALKVEPTEALRSEG